MSPMSNICIANVMLDVCIAHYLPHSLTCYFHSIVSFDEQMFSVLIYSQFINVFMYSCFCALFRKSSTTPRS